LAEPSANSSAAPRSGDAVQRDVVHEVPGDELGRGVVPQRLLDPRVHRRLAGEDALAPPRVCGEVVEGVAEQLRRRLVAGHHHEEEEPDDLVVGHAVALDLGGDQRRRQVVGRPPVPLRDVLPVVLEELHRRLDAGRRDVAQPVLAVDQEVGQPPHLGAVGRRDAEHLGDDVHRHLAGEVADPVEVRGAGRRERRVEVVLGDPPDLRLQLQDAARREAARDQLAQPRLLRRVHRQERHHRVRVRVPGAAVQRDAHRVAVRGIRAQRGVDVGVPRQHPEVVCLVVVQRRLAAQARVDRVRVVLEGVVVGVEVERRRRAVQAGAHEVPARITATTSSSRRASSS
jgi:hypothetical protein